ncbi:hypothetical protein [Nocardia sp. NPDC049149]|uniref:hypothetical protein n=1 Tax=Nocardia sp. NPDC049149 TaxID=3364315 RepID=UPI0037120FFF
MIDPTSHTGRVLAALADGNPRTAREICDLADLPTVRVTTIANRLHGAAQLRLHGLRPDKRGRLRKVWAITDEGRAKLVAAVAEKAGTK